LLFASCSRDFKEKTLVAFACN